MCNPESKIPLYIDNGVPYVWNADDWHSLRGKYKICGALIGTIPSFPRQNDFSGLPMVLMSEEAALLVEKGICELIELPNIRSFPSEEEKVQIDAQEQKVLLEQAEALKKRKIEQLTQKIEIIAAGKRQKLLSKGIADVTLDKHTLLQEEINKLQKISPASMLVHIPTEHYMDTAKSVLGVEVLNPSIVDRCGFSKFSIFKDLWQKGYHVTNGSKFGCDYLVYPGDPVRFHAMYMVRCIFDQTALFKPANLVAFGRLSVAVNKLAVLAFCPGNNKVEYQTLKWHDSVHGMK